MLGVLLRVSEDRRFLAPAALDGATVLALVHVGVPFLGFRIWPRQIRLDGARRRRFHRRVRWLARRPEAEASVRAQGVIAWLARGDTVQLRRVAFARQSGLARGDRRR